MRCSVPFPSGRDLTFLAIARLGWVGAVQSWFDWTDQTVGLRRARRSGLRVKATARRGTCVHLGNCRMKFSVAVYRQPSNSKRDHFGLISGQSRSTSRASGSCLASIIRYLSAGPPLVPLILRQEVVVAQTSNAARNVQWPNKLPSTPWDRVRHQPLSLSLRSKITSRCIGRCRPPSLRSLRPSLKAIGLAADEPMSRRTAQGRVL